MIFSNNFNLITHFIMFNITSVIYNFKCLSAEHIHLMHLSKLGLWPCDHSVSTSYNFFYKSGIDYRPLLRRLDRCNRMIQNESRHPNGGTSQCKLRSLCANTRLQERSCIMTYTSPLKTHWLYWSPIAMILFAVFLHLRNGFHGNRNHRV